MIKIRRPFDGEYSVTQEYGSIYQLKGISREHEGVDWGLPCGTPVLAVADGMVNRIDRTFTAFDYGKNVTIQHDGFDTFSAHLRSILVKPLQLVKAGDLIGYSGKTGFVLGRTGCHLHFGVRIEGRWIDPMGHLDTGGGEPRYVPEPSEKLVPLYRLYNPKTGDHFYTVSEKEALNATLELGYKDEGIIGFIVEPQK